FSVYSCTRHLHSFPTRRSSDLGGKLIVAESFEPRSREEIHGERKIEGFPNLRIADFRVMKPAGFQNEGAEPGTRKLHLVVHQNGDRKSTRLNSSHRTISYAVFC